VPYLSITVSGRAPGKLSQLVAYLDDRAIREYVDAEGRLRAPIRSRACFYLDIMPLIRPKEGL